MKKSKVCFFDIDGTLWDVKNEIPESTMDAIRGLRENGHRVFLCSGRTRAYIHHPALLDMGFDGIVSGCGTMIEYQGETLFYKRLDPELVIRTVKIVTSYGFFPVLEGKEYLYMDLEGFSDAFYGKKLSQELGDRMLSLKDNWGAWDVSKMTCACRNGDIISCLEEVKEDFAAFVHRNIAFELVPKGFNKGTGVRRVCELLGVDVADSFAFGDSANDRDMLQSAGIGIAMGNGTKEAKEAADYITTDMKEHGIWNACHHFGLIG